MHAYHNIIGVETSAQGHDFIEAFNPREMQNLPGRFPVATDAEVALAMKKAAAAAEPCRKLTGRKKAAFLRAVADAIEAMGAPLIERAMAETGLPEARLLGERGRTCGQLRLFAELLEEGSWVDAVIDPAMPERQPLPRPDIRRMLVGIGPVVVFTAGNFPLAFSTAGGDTASALAAGCPVVVKAHEAHPGTHALVADAIREAAINTGMPDGIFSALYGKGFELGRVLVTHPAVKAVAFTGSYQGGKALFDLAAQRPEPIPVLAEMGSVNPIFVLPETMSQRGEALAQQIAASVNLGAGQFCTNPGLVVCLENADTPVFLKALAGAMAQQAPAPMLSPGIYANFETRRQAGLAQRGVRLEYADKPGSEKTSVVAYPTLASVEAAVFLKNPHLHEEVFGPFSLVVRCRNSAEMLRVARGLRGQLTVTLLGGDAELTKQRKLADALLEKAGRLLFNGVPTGVEVCRAMQHGGPFPASTDSRFTSVGTAAIRRFVRPVAFQNWPALLLPPELKNHNPLRIWRQVNGVLTKKKHS